MELSPGTSSRQGKEQQFAGKSSYENGILTMVQNQNNNTMVGNVNWTDDISFHVQDHRRPNHRCPASHSQKSS